MLDKAMRVLLRVLYSTIFAVVASVVGFRIIGHLLMLWEYSPAWVNYVGAYLGLIMILTMPILFVLGYRWLSQKQAK